MNRSKHLAATVAAVLLLVAGLYAAGLQLPNGPSADDDTDGNRSGRVLAVNTLVAKQTPSYLLKRTLSGIVKARRSGDLSFLRSGRLQRVLVDQGAEVSSGDPLAELDTQRLKDQKTKLESARERADERLTKLIADSRFRSMEAIRVEVQSLRAQLDQLSEEIKNKDAERESAARNTASTQDRLDSAQQRLQALEATSSDPQVVQQQAAVGDLEQQIAQLDTELEESTLRAPYDGIISLRYVSDGMLVSPSVPIMRIVESDAAEVWLGLPADVAESIAAGETYGVQIGQQDLDAVVRAKLPELDRTARTRTVVLTVDASGSEKILPGELARIELDRRVQSVGYWLPVTSLTRKSGGLWSVYVVEPGDDGQQIVARRDVEVIDVQDERARVRGTLSDGALVISDGTHRVVPGQRVRGINTALAGEVATDSGARSGGSRSLP